MLVSSFLIKKKANNFLFLNQRLLKWKIKFGKIPILLQNTKLRYFFYHKKNFNEKKKNKKKAIFFFGNWVWELSLGIFFLFFGFFSATSAITIIGSVADWDPLAAAVMLCWIEFFTKFFYNSNKITLLLKLINSFKIGINLGMFVDAFKLTG
jgi:hypothetical protein